MNLSQILIAYSSGGEKIALDLVEDLNQLGTVLIRSYSNLALTPQEEEFDAAVCVVTDGASITRAHELQKSWECPTLVVNCHPREIIPVNGFAGLATPDSRQTMLMVREILAGRQQEHFPASHERNSGDHTRRILTSRFDATISRLAELPSALETTLAAATRQLAWELRTQTAETYIVNLNEPPQCIFALPGNLPEGDVPSIKVIRLLSRKAYAFGLADIRGPKEKPLLEYLQKRGMTVVAPITRQGSWIGWIALGMDENAVTSDFLDELQIVTHLLSLGLVAPSKAADPNEWGSILTAFETVLLSVSAEGIITQIAGGSEYLGHHVSRGDSFLEVRNARIRQIIAGALAGNFTSDRWLDPVSGKSLQGEAKSLPDGVVAVNFSAAGLPSNVAACCDVELVPLLESLSLPVTPDASAGYSPQIPHGCVTAADSERIVRCANLAKQKSVKALKLRYDADEKGGRGVLFSECSSSETASRLVEDIGSAVEFVVSRTRKPEHVGLQI
jgi:hypothetical protein